MLPDPAEGKTVAPVPVQKKEHVADIELLHPLSEEGDVATADWSYIQHLSLLPPLKALDEEPKDIAGVAG